MPHRYKGQRLSTYKSTYRHSMEPIRERNLYIPTMRELHNQYTNINSNNASAILKGTYYGSVPNLAANKNRQVIRNLITKYKHIYIHSKNKKSVVDEFVDEYNYALVLLKMEHIRQLKSIYI